MAVNKQAKNFRSARAAGFKPGTAIRDDSGKVIGGTKLPARRPLPPLPGREPLNPINGAPGRPRNYSDTVNYHDSPRPRGPIGTVTAGQGIDESKDPRIPMGGGSPMMTKPMKLPGGMTPQPMPPGSEAGKADMVNASARNAGGPGSIPPGGGMPAPPQFPGSGGIYGGPYWSGPAMAGGMDQSVGSDGLGGPSSTPVRGLPPGADIGMGIQESPDQVAPGGGNQAMQDYLSQIQLPKRFQGNIQQAMQFMQQNPQSRLGRGFAAGAPQMGPMNYNPLLGG